MVPPVRPPDQHHGGGDAYSPSPRDFVIIREVYDSDNFYEKFELELEAALNQGLGLTSHYVKI